MRISIVVLSLIIGVSVVTVDAAGQRPSAKPAARPTTPDTPSASETQGIKTGTLELKPETLLEKQEGVRCDPMQQEHLNLSANLEGNIQFISGRQGKGSLKIVDNKFTLTIDEATTLQGKVSATKTCGYTAVALTFDEPSRAILKAANIPEMGISLHPQKCGSGLVLAAVPEEDRSFVFKESSAGSCGPYCPRPPCPKRSQGRR